jgi:hypothetical protein
LTATVPGALLGVALFFLARPLVALVPLDGNTWFPDAIAPPLGQTIALLLLVQVVGAVSSVLALRRIAISPLGVTRRERSRPLSRLRVVPLAMSMAGFAVALLLIPIVGQLALWLIAAAFFGVIVGIAIAGSWITMLVGRAFGAVARGPSQLLAARRLTDDPRSSFGAIAGVVMAVFVASVFYSLVAFAADANGRIGGPALPRDTLDVTLPLQPGRAEPDALAIAIAAQDGVRSVGVIRSGQATTADGAVINAWAADCAAVSALLPEGGPCGPKTVYGADDVSGLQFSGSAATAGPDIPLGSGAYAPPAPLATPSTTHPLPVDAPLATQIDVLLTPDLLPADGAAFAVTRLLIATDGRATTIERARTSVEAASPTATAWTVAEQWASARGPLDELGRIVAIGLVGTLLVAGCSLAIAVVGGIVERRRPLALLRLSGMPIRRLQAMAVMEAAVPLLVVTVVAAAIGIVVAQILLRLGTAGGTPPLPGLEFALVLFLGVTGALGVVALTLPMIRRATELETTRFE